MKCSSIFPVVGLLLLIVVSAAFAGCAAQPSVNTYHGKTFSLNYPRDWQIFDAYKLGKFPESYRSMMPEVVIFAPSLKYPTPVIIATYVYPISDPFGKQDAELKLDNITQGRGITFSYLTTITMDGEPAYVYRSYDTYGNAARNVLLRKGSSLYYVQGYEDEKNLNLLIQSFKSTP